MSELYDEWAQMIAEAEKRARAAGRADVVDYLNLRASNDLVRQTSIKWLVESFIEMAAIANRIGAAISIEKDDAHRFCEGNATMVGQVLTLRSGVRELIIEAGWPRAPGDGIVRGGGLAYGNIRHFGERSADDKILLMRRERLKSPEWIVLGKDARRLPLLVTGIRHHIARLVGKHRVS